MGQMLLEGDILALPSVEFYGAVETLGIVIAVGGGFEEEAGASKLPRSEWDAKDKRLSDLPLRQRATREARTRSRLVSSFESRRVSW